MVLPQRKFREIVFQILYAQDFMENEEEEILLFMMKKHKVTKKVVKKAFSYVNEIRKKVKRLDKDIKEASRSYELKRISKVELNILRLEVYEFLFQEDVPAKVAISEGVRLCRKFGTSSGANFVNAVLDNICRRYGYRGKGSKR